MSQSIINVVVYQPENSGNLGNIIRTCYIYDAQLHLIRPYGWVGNLRYFQTELKDVPQAQLVRAAVDCFDKVKIHQYDHWDDFYQIVTNQDQLAFLTKFGNQQIDEWINNIHKMQKLGQIYLVFGSETFGLTKLAGHFDFTDFNQVQLAGQNTNKSHNLANAVAISLHLVWTKFK